MRRPSHLRTYSMARGTILRVLLIRACDDCRDNPDACQVDRRNSAVRAARCCSCQDLLFQRQQEPLETPGRCTAAQTQQCQQSPEMVAGASSDARILVTA